MKIGEYEKLCGILTAKMKIWAMRMVILGKVLHKIAGIVEMVEKNFAGVEA